MKESRLLDIYELALEKACKMMRDHPFGDVEDYPQDMVKLLIGGKDRDPDGIEYQDYFLFKAIDELGGVCNE